ncbi:MULTISPECIES: hypothetical protein [Serratia]|uniref:Uncharacterized protein n=1 Tax=Serratia quinivorans TaxID=137545 RepID=A0A379Z1H2_9GAMM|nr:MULTISPECIES: hypothetical protein [Serratia]QBX66952.1 hypothetical protein E4343_12520 [Serratia quinivorans]RYM63703.1 hypothetical protein BSR03_05910 [Serratia proteamaculans]CAI1073113.1 Uncharacterised protein [Serratia quinivorans]CAI1139951.1 Uncharacterised protein [Serratia quinivorans]CAI1917655.1 Uncharacterised protein [Serratia quinivorans]
MSSLQKVTDAATLERLSLDLGSKLHAAARDIMKKKLQTGEYQMINGRIVSVDHKRSKKTVVEV